MNILLGTIDIANDVSFDDLETQDDEWGLEEKDEWGLEEKDEWGLEEKDEWGLQENDFV